MSGGSPALPLVSKYWPHFGHCSWICCVGRRQFLGAHVRRRQAVLEAEPDRHHGLAGEHAVAEHLALRRLGEQLDAELAARCRGSAPARRSARCLAGGLDDDLQRPAVGQQAHAAVVALRSGRSRRAARWPGPDRTRPRPSGTPRGTAGFAASTVLLPSTARPKKITWLISSRSIASDSARRNRTSRNSSRQTGSATLRLGNSAMCEPLARVATAAREVLALLVLA